MAQIGSLYLRAEKQQIVCQSSVCLYNKNLAIFIDGLNRALL